MNWTLISNPNFESVFAKVCWRFNILAFQSELAILLGAPNAPLELPWFCNRMCLGDWQIAGFRQIFLNQVLGTKEECTEFDRVFRPKNVKSLRSDWIATGISFLIDRKITEMHFYQWGEAYFVADRSSGIMVSVLKAFGVISIGAQYSLPEIAKVQPPTIQAFEYWEHQDQEK